MKKLIYISIFCLGFSSFAQDVLWEESFETDGDGVRYYTSNTFHDGISDYFVRTDGIGIDVACPIGSNSMYSKPDGDFFFAAEDTDDNGGDELDAKTVNFDTIIITGYENLIFSGLFAAGSNCQEPSVYDFADGAVISYSFDKGLSWTQIIKFRYDNADTNAFNSQIGLVDVIDQNCVMDSDGGFGSFNGPCRAEAADGGTNISDYLSEDFREYSAYIPTNGEDTLFLMIELSFDAAPEEFAFDGFRIEGDLVTTIQAPEVISEGISFYPNPSQGRVNVMSPEPVTTLIRDFNNRVVADGGAQIDVSHLSSGTYIIEINTVSEQYIDQIVIE